MKHQIAATLWAFAGLAIMASCSQESQPSAPLEAKATPMTFSVSHPAQTRATATAFETGDKVGVYVAADTAVLEIGGNLVNNEPLTYDGTRWNASRTLYWDEGSYTAYAYYPYQQQLSSIDNLPFSVSTDQTTAKTATALGGYEASDFLYAKTTGVAASNNAVPLTFKHIMSKLTVRLVKGEDFEGDMPATTDVFIYNTVPTATIDLSAGVATRYVKGTSATIKARQTGDYTYSAIIVPQRLSNRVPLIEVTVKGVSYLYESKFHFKPGVEHLVNLVISDNPERVKIEIGGEIQGWQ